MMRSKAKSEPATKYMLRCAAQGCERRVVWRTTDGYCLEHYGRARKGEVITRKNGAEAIKPDKRGERGVGSGGESCRLDRGSAAKGKTRKSGSPSQVKLSKRDKEVAVPLTTFEDYTVHSKPPTACGLVQGILSSATYAHPVKSVYIEIELDIKGNEVRACIHYLRCAGYPIGSSAKGYWWAQTSEELATTILHGEQRARSNLAWVRGLRRASQVMTEGHEQGELGDEVLAARVKLSHNTA